MPNDARDLDGSEDEAEGGGGLSLAVIKQIAGFFLRAPRRHPLLAALTFVAILAVTGVLAVFLPRTYTAEIHVIAKQDLVLPALGNPRRSIPTQADDPTKGIAAEITKRDNLATIIKQTRLVERWDAIRTPASRIKEGILQKLTGPPSDDDKMEALVGMLGKRLTVTVAPEDITILVEWTDKALPLELVNALYDNFVSTRLAENLGEINDAIAILESHAQTAHDKVDAALSELTTLEKRKGATSSSPASSPGVAAPSALPAASRSAPRAAPSPQDQGEAEALKQLDEVRLELRAVADERRRALAEAASQLADAQATLGPMHPTVIALKQKLEARQAPSPELSDLRTRESALLLRIASAGSPPDARPEGRSPSPRYDNGNGARQGTASAANELLEKRDDAPTGFARAALISAAGDYDNLRDRIDAAQIELDIQRASSKHMYTVSHPAELPKKPKKPNVVLVVLGGILAAVALAFVSAGLRDLASGRYIEEWQVEYNLDLPVLGNLPG